MNQFIEKKRKSAKIFAIILTVLVALWIGSFFVHSNLEKDISYPIIIWLGMTVIFGVISYLVSYIPFFNNVKWLRSRGLECAADDIILERPTLPRSKIYCGQYAFFCKKLGVIIPYSEIAWVYVHETRTYGITVEKTVIVYTKEGRTFTLNSHVDEFKWLLENYIMPYSPNVVIGYGAEQKARYKQLNPEWVEAGKKVKRIWGIVLISLGIAFFILMLINFENVQIVPVTILILGCLLSGTVLYMLGKKK